MRELAYAKLNLALRILSRRHDGFHEIDSIVQTISLADRLTVELQDQGLDVENDLGVRPDEDLAVRAAALVLREKGVSDGARITVTKGIPAGAGLGGGSSDAAAVLVALDRLTPPPLPRETLHLLAERLGSDVPLFLVGGRLRMAGRGERIAALRAGEREWFVVLVPPIQCLTPLVYKCFDEIHCRVGIAEGLVSLGENDLEQAALTVYPELLPYQRAVRELEARYSGMSGSGSSFFAAFDEKGAADVAQRVLARSFPEARSFLSSSTRRGQRLEGEAVADCD